MNSLCDRIRVFAGAWLLVALFSSFGQATELIGYMGPGAGLSMLGALLAVACVLFIAILAPILYPIRAFRAWRRRCREQHSLLAAANVSSDERARLATAADHLS